MKVTAAYIGVILIWSTTPLAIKFSTDSLSFIVAVGLRMSSAALLCLAIMAVLGRFPRWDRAALKAYETALLAYPNHVHAASIRLQVDRLRRTNETDALRGRG